MKSENLSRKTFELLNTTQHDSVHTVTIVQECTQMETISQCAELLLGRNTLPFVSPQMTSCSIVYVWTYNNYGDAVEWVVVSRPVANVRVILLITFTSGQWLFDSPLHYIQLWLDVSIKLHSHHVYNGG